METVPDALASTPATFSLKTTLPLERGLDSKNRPLKAKLQRQRLPLETSSQFSPGPPHISRILPSELKMARFAWDILAIYSGIAFPPQRWLRFLCPGPRSIVKNILWCLWRPSKFL